ncbi:hypothetical protein D3C87_2010900 [compost metagenome]
MDNYNEVLESRVVIKVRTLLFGRSNFGGDFFESFLNPRHVKLNVHVVTKVIASISIWVVRFRGRGLLKNADDKVLLT